MEYSEPAADTSSVVIKRSWILYQFRRSNVMYFVLRVCAYVRKGHDDVIKWRHFPPYWPFVQGIYRLPVYVPHKGQCRGALMFSLTCAWINGWANNREAGDLRRHRAHCVVTIKAVFNSQWAGKLDNLQLPMRLWLCYHSIKFNKLPLVITVCIVSQHMLHKYTSYIPSINWFPLRCCKVKNNSECLEESPRLTNSGINGSGVTYFLVFNVSVVLCW